jgi:6-pyruvoyltetrahydropterin/6-carboxytetrahydropterin synthase
MMRLTRRYRFSASHRLHSGDLTADQNRDLYGKCNNPHGHGHDYILDVGVSGPLDRSTGRVVAVPSLDALVRDSVLRDLDHRNLNADAPEFAQTPATTENLAIAIRQRLLEHWPAAWPRLETVRLQETRRNRFELKV